MEGVKILNEIGPMSGGAWIAIGSFVFMGIVSLIGILIDTNLDKKGKFVSILVCILLFAFAAILFFSTYTSPMKYEVIVDDNVKLTEFEEKYRIIERRENIYVVEERESNEK